MFYHFRALSLLWYSKALKNTNSSASQYALSSTPETQPTF
jgi:hypothetical protein